MPWLEPGDCVTADDLLAVERDQHIRAGRGDIVCVRVGHRSRRTDEGPWDAAEARAGLHPIQCVIAPLRLPTSTGSPVNPIAIL